MMTRTDFKALAAALANARPGSESGVAGFQWAVDRSAIADALAASNPRFNRGRFYDATRRDTSSLCAATRQCSADSDVLH